MRILALTLSLVLISHVSWARGVELIFKNNTAVRDSKKEKHLEAYETFLSLTADDPYEPTLLFNLGASLTAVGEEEKSEALFKELLKSIDGRLAQATSQDERMELTRLKYAVLYNLGVHYQGVKNIDAALDYYQKGLELKPDSKEIKTNIELMLNSEGKGEGKGDSKDKKGEGEGDGEKDPQDKEGEDKKEQKQPKEPSEKEKQEQKKKQFDQSQMSMEDLNRIMEELKQQEQKIRAKVQQKGGKDEPREKQW